MSTPEPFVSQMDIAHLTWEQFRAVNDVYRRWVADVWMYNDTRTYGMRLTNLPAMSASGIYETIAGAVPPAPIGIPTDDRGEHGG